MANHYEVPNWAGKPPTGLHLDVLKGDKLIQKLMIDEKKCYLFGRNPQMNDFCIDHASCSRVHAAFVYHKHLNRAFLVDLGSTHGTYIGQMRLEAHKPTQLPIDSSFHFGASTRNYIIRAGKPPTGLHLDVLKGDKLIQKLMIDEKKCYLFGRNPQMNDFCIDHASCSRVHAAFVYHKHLNRAFLVDLGSTHGTYIGQMRLEAHKPTQLPIDSSFHFGASTRNYIIRERPTGNARGIMEDLPNTETEASEEAGPSSEPRKKKYAKEAWPGRKPALIPGV
ncbi:hypothetical protein O3G_MSEX012302 [Manduca sexta]|uniref:Nuclear inhibitor of protein phosphatase 1 n=1 Tax=Manduca sexta TaxID=7130 RepID=A0A921ZPC6_MANSE|nr:hypothetical protein O3G_MSEX012302 [Manduca sexta]